MFTYRKLPVEVEAFQYDGDFTYSDGTPYEAPEWIFKALDDGTMYFKDAGDLYIKTLEGDHRADAGDYIIRGIKGELYPCKPDIFNATYENLSTLKGNVTVGKANRPNMERETRAKIEQLLVRAAADNAYRACEEAEKATGTGPCCISEATPVVERPQEIARLTGWNEALKWCVETILLSDRMGKHS